MGENYKIYTKKIWYSFNYCKRNWVPTQPTDKSNFLSLIELHPHVLISNISKTGEGTTQY